MSERREPLCSKGSAWKREEERERKKERHGETKLLWWARPVTLFSKGTFIPWLVHRGKWRMQGHAESAQTLQQFCPYQNQDFFCKPFPQMMLCTLSSGLGGLWTLYDPLLIKAAQPENLFSLKCFFFIFLIHVSLRKYQSYVLMEQRSSELQRRKNQLAQRSDVVKFKATILFFSHSNYVN